MAEDLINDLYDIGVQAVLESFNIVIKFVNDNKDLDQKSFASKLKEQEFTSTIKSWCFSYRKDSKIVYNNYIETILDYSLKNIYFKSKMSYKKMVALDE